MGHYDTAIFNVIRKRIFVILFDRAILDSIEMVSRLHDCYGIVLDL